MSKKKALGRGLSALLKDNDEAEDKLEVDIPVNTSISAAPPAPISGINEIPIEHIEVNPFQPRTHFDQDALLELAESIKVHGIIQPITVRRLATNQYQLISGERRFQASKLADLKSIPAYVRSADDQQMLEMALIENIQRENLNAIEISLSYQRLLTECSLKQDNGNQLSTPVKTSTRYPDSSARQPAFDGSCTRDYQR
jgi:ParB family chromosome partitioning protein